MSSSRKVTDFPENYYYRINRMLLAKSNLWPYQRSKFTTFNHVVNIVIFVSFIFFQLTSFFTVEATMDNIIMVLMYVLPSIIFIIQYSSFYRQPSKIQRLWQSIHENWSILKNDAERDIMRQHALYGEFWTKVTIVCIFSGLSGYTLLQFLPVILDVLFPLNETRPRQPYAVTEYFVDQEKYFNLLLCHWLIAIYLFLFIFIATLMLQMIYMEHICGLLNIVSYRIEHSIDGYASRAPTKKLDRESLRHIKDAVNLHQRAFECIFLLTSIFSREVFFVAVISVIALSLCMFQSLRAFTSFNINDLIPSLSLTVAYFAIMFLVNHNGQRVTDYNYMILYNAYNIKWYNVPVKIQMAFLLIMKATTKAYVLNIGNLILASREGFAKMVSLSISYFTVLHSVH